MASKQHVATATATHATTEEMWDVGFSVGSVQRLHLENQNWRRFSQVVSVNTEAEEYTLLGDITKQQPMKTQQTKNKYVPQRIIKCVWISDSA